MDRDEAGAASTATDTDREIVRIVDALDGGDRKLAAFLRSLGQRIEPFEADLTRVREDFRTAVAMNDDLLAAAADLRSFADGLPLDGDGRDGFPFLETLMQPRYTMAREREVHMEVFGRRLAA